jgi:hypothetical protein
MVASQVTECTNENFRQLSPAEVEAISGAGASDYPILPR